MENYIGINCCICEEKVTKEDDGVLVQLPYHATWNFPTHGDILKGTDSLAVALVHAKCVDALNGTTIGYHLSKIKYAIELYDNHVIYHPLKDLIPSTHAGGPFDPTQNQ